MRALITGASSGMGRDMAKYLASFGYDLFVVSKNKEDLEDIFKDLNVKVVSIGLDLTEVDNCIKLHKMLKKENIDILINNAGFGDAGNFSETSLNKELNMIDLNIKAYHILTKLFLQDFIKRDYGRILNVASMAGFMPGPYMDTYYATKAYIVSFTEALYEELRRNKSHVKVSLLCPGPVKTNFNKVANVNFNIKQLDAKYVSRYAINNLLRGNKLLIVPGFSIRLGVFLTRFLPVKFILKITYNIQKRKK